MGPNIPYALYLDTLNDNVVLFEDPLPPVALQRFVLLSSWVLSRDGKKLEIEYSTGVLEAIKHKKLSEYLPETQIPVIKMKTTLGEYLLQMHSDVLLPNRAHSSSSASSSFDDY